MSRFSPEKEGLIAENQEGEKKKEIWPVSFSQDGKILGLPKEVKPEEVIVFIGPDGKWYAQLPSKETLKEIEHWRADWRPEKE
jgi:hypothetical protein